MRVTNNMRQTQVLRDLQAGLAKLADAQQQVSTGKRFSRPSEDPVAASSVMRADRSLRGITQYRRNSTAVRVRVDAEEATLNQLTDLLTRAKELGVGQGSDTATPTTGLEVIARRGDELALVVADQRMRRISGLEILRQVRRRPRRIPVILMSGYPSLDPPDGMEGPDAFLRKPFELLDLARTVQRLVGGDSARA